MIQKTYSDASNINEKNGWGVKDLGRGLKYIPIFLLIL